MQLQIAMSEGQAFFEAVGGMEDVIDLIGATTLANPGKKRELTDALTSYICKDRLQEVCNQ